MLLEVFEVFFSFIRCESKNNTTERYHRHISIDASRLEGRVWNAEIQDDQQLSFKFFFPAACFSMRMQKKYLRQCSDYLPRVHCSRYASIVSIKSRSRTRQQRAVRDIDNWKLGKLIRWREENYVYKVVIAALYSLHKQHILCDMREFTRNCVLLAFSTVTKE